MQYRFHCETDKRRGIAIICWVIAIPLTLFLSCNSGKKEMVDFVFDRDTSYTMKSTDVVMLISDSGITRFRLEAKEWYVFDEATEPYSFFPEKVRAEQFDSLFRMVASFDADTAYNYSQKKLWKFAGNVKAVNSEGQQFETSLLFWNEGEKRVYSDQFIRITKGDFVNTGTGFEANETLTQYSIFNSKAEIPIQENDPTETVNVENAPPP